MQRGSQRLQMRRSPSKRTNTDITLEEKHTPEDDLLFARNKWLLSHPDANIAGSVAGIKGENLSVK